MIESFDKDLELKDEAELSAREYLQDLVGRLELLETKCYSPVATGEALKKMFNKLSMGPTPREKNVAEIIKEIRRGKNVC